MDVRLPLFVSSVLLTGALVTFFACGDAVHHQPASDCVPECGTQNRECGSDGCGGTCGVCAADEICTFEGRCVVDGCVPDCTLAECGDDGCGTQCGTCAAPTPLCSPERRCVDCIPNCTNRVCGTDGCGGSCGECMTPFVCDEVNGTCCQPNCTGRECGDDGCGGSCGTCTGTTTCEGGVCM